ncbi:MAG: hypothetical protein WA414_13165 [Acidobacteriaceae bacterium]
MTLDMDNNTDDRIVVGYFTRSADASRAINELIDEGFQIAEIGAAFRTSRAGLEAAEGGRSKGISNPNPAVTGSVGGAASHDEAVTPAGLAPGSGNAFPGASRPGPITGSEIPSTIPSTLRHELRHDLPSTLRSESEIGVAPVQVRDEGWEFEEARRGRLREVFGDNTENAKRSSSMKFGTGEGHLFPDYEYSEPSFENSFLGMGLGGREARGLSSELNRGGAVVSVTPGSRASLAEGILERNHGRVRFESMAGTTGEIADGARVEIYGRMRNYYRPDESFRRKAS